MGVLRRVTIHQLRVPKKEKQWTEAAMILGFLLTVLWLWYGSVVFVVLGGLVFLLFIYGYLEAKTKTRKKKVSVVTTEVLKKPKVQQKPKVHLARNEKGRFIKRQASEGLSYERTRWTKEKYSPFSENFAATIAQTLIRIYNQNKLPNYYNSFYLPLGLTKKEVETDQNKIYWMIVLAAYDRQPFTRVAKGWEAIWGTKRESDSIRATLNEAGLLNMEAVSALTTDEIHNRLTQKKFRGYRIDSDGAYTDYARTIKDAAQVVKGRQLLNLMIKANDPDHVKTIFDLLDSVHGIGPTIASKLVMYTFREIGIGQISHSNLYPAVAPILKEYHNIKLVKEIERVYGVGFADAIFESLKKLGDPFAIDALYYHYQSEQQMDLRPSCTRGVMPRFSKRGRVTEGDRRSHAPERQ